MIAIFFSKEIKAQVIEKFEVLQSKNDSSSVIYSFKVSFDSFLDVENRDRLVKIELLKNHKITSERILLIDSFIDKRPKVFRYQVVIKNQ